MFILSKAGKERTGKVPITPTYYNTIVDKMYHEVWKQVIYGKPFDSLRQRLGTNESGQQLFPMPNSRRHFLVHQNEMHEAKPSLEIAIDGETLAKAMRTSETTLKKSYSGHGFLTLNEATFENAAALCNTAVAPAAGAHEPTTNVVEDERLKREKAATQTRKRHDGGGVDTVAANNSPELQRDSRGAIKFDASRLHLKRSHHPTDVLDKQTGRPQRALEMDSDATRAACVASSVACGRQDELDQDEEHSIVRGKMKRKRKRSQGSEFPIRSPSCQWKLLGRLSPARRKTWHVAQNRTL